MVGDWCAFKVDLDVEVLGSVQAEIPAAMNGHAIPAGTLIPTWPRTSLFTGPPDSTYLKTACQQSCWCANPSQNIPASPLDAIAGIPAQCSRGENAEPNPNPPAVACESPQYRDSSTLDRIVCSGSVYGHVVDSDCIEVNVQIGTIIGTATRPQDLYEFLNQGAPSIFGNYPRVDTPYSIRYGK